MNFKPQIPSYKDGNIPNMQKTLKDLYGAYLDLIEQMKHMLRHLEDDNIDAVSANKITAGIIKATIEIIGPTITGGLIRTGIKPNQRLELEGNQIKCYNSSNQLQGFVIDDDGGQHYGDASFYINGTKALSIYNSLIDGFSIFPVNGFPLSFGNTGTTINHYGAHNFYGETTAYDITLKKIEEPPEPEEDKAKLYFDGENLNVVLPDGSTVIIA